ncbi:DUF2306 domain-containing protein [Streptomyces sp. NPDC093982]|jgi:uncharacterized membrane protein|uniref:DUF2306 domain-containing protein n=1 Tax=Streptomyces sp. NPDC093982 TaxID=3155077 RepID=UPI003424AED8
MDYEQQSSVAPADTSGAHRAARSSSVPRRRRPRGQTVALVLLALSVVGVLISVWSRYITFDSGKSRLSPSEHPLFFPLLMIHIVGSTVAIITCVLQVWPSLRRRKPHIHRLSGRLYVLAGIYPAASTALVLTLVWPYAPLNAASDILTSILWLSITTYGFVLARQGRTADHRRWMLRSFALTMTVVSNTILLLPIGWVVKPLLHSHFAGDEEVMLQVWSGLDVWLGWTLALLLVEWWLEREQLRRSARQAKARKNRERKDGERKDRAAVAEVPG